ncbi:vitamin K epoxide reductase family protein [Patescibacteria group bacterium]|nr:vitamin K epoxide reductase family protein [Patescibacteria group bacterium]
MKRLSPSLARLLMVVAALIGFFASGYLFYEYVTGGRIACAIVSGCDVVRSSSWATSFGIPRPFFGLVFYGAVFYLLILRTILTKWARELYLATIAFAVIGFIESALLFVVQWLDLKAFCFWCLLSGLAATVVFFAMLVDRPIPAEEGVRARELKRIFWVLALYAPIAVASFIWLTQLS